MVRFIYLFLCVVRFAWLCKWVVGCSMQPTLEFMSVGEVFLFSALELSVLSPLAKAFNFSHLARH